MSKFFVNGSPVEFSGDYSLLKFLREDLKLTSVKEGCSEGVCGTCMVLVDGKAVRACRMTAEKLAGKKVLTIEGLSQWEKDLYAHCFAAAGAVQCGFCIPGMIISAKGLLGSNPSPSRADVKKAIKGNICRCTGYVKIEDAILMASRLAPERSRLNAPCGEQHRLHADEASVSVSKPDTFTGRLGEDFFRLDAEEKTLGTGLYTDDLTVEGMVYAKALRTEYPRARVLAMDISRAKSHEGCIDLITAADVPGNIKCGHIIKDWDALIGVGGITRYVGDALAIVVADSPEILDEVLALVEVEYEELTPLTSPAEALAETAPKIHENGNILSRQALKRGNADEAISRAKYKVTNHFSLPFTEHAFMEPECAIAMPDGPEGDGLLIYSGGQSVYDEQHEISGLLGIPPEKIRVKSMLVGGGFGGKEDMSVQHHAALAAWITKKPVKIKFSRDESLLVHPKRHAMEIDLTVACDENGIITAAKGKIVSDTGAYASLGGPVLQRACTHVGGPYNFQNIDVEGTAVITNNPPAGAFRGFGVPQAAFAMENSLNLLAEKVGISPWEIRYRNAIRPGQVLPNGQIADDSTAFEECLLAVREIYENAPVAGIAAGFKNTGLGVGVPDVSRCILSIEKGKIHVRSSAACIGQGMATVLAQMVCETLGCPPDLLVVEAPDTARTPNSGTTTASRQTVFSGEAAVAAARGLCEAAITAEMHVKQHARPEAGSKAVDWERVLRELEGQEFYGEYFPSTDPMGSDKPNPVSHVAYGYGVQVVELNKDGKLTKVTAAYDAGKVVNPKLAEGQLEGGILMGLGYALTEDFPVEGGYLATKYSKLGLFRATETPEMEIIFVRKESFLPAAHGAKGVGELATIPTAPAVQGAYYKLDGQFRTRLPLSATYYELETYKCLPTDDKNSSSNCIVFHPEDCILCENCIEVCGAAIDPTKGGDLSELGCVGCGQCRIECPTGAIKVKSSITEVLTAIKDENSMVVAQIAPAVRVGLGGMFDLPGDVNAMEIIVGAMRQMGFDRIFDTSFGADLTIAEECEELLHRLSSGENLPLMTSCCPAWVRFCEDRYPQFAENISTCRSPHQMLGAAIRAHYKETERVVIVSVMPCTAKKNETQPDVDYVITTSELACLIKQQGIVLADCQPSKTDEPFGQASMDALHFGAAGGVAKAITSHLDTDIKAVSVSGLANATELMQKLEKGEVQYDLVEVMACPGGCIMGGGQPVPRQLSKQVKLKRENALHK